MATEAIGENSLQRVMAVTPETALSHCSRTCARVRDYPEVPSLPSLPSPQRFAAGHDWLPPSPWAEVVELDRPWIRRIVWVGL